MLATYGGQAPYLLRETAADDVPVEKKPPEELTQRDLLLLQIKATQEQVRLHRQTRIWTIVGGMVGVGTLAVAIMATRRS